MKTMNQQSMTELLKSQKKRVSALSTSALIYFISQEAQMGKADTTYFCYAFYK